MALQGVRIFLQVRPNSIPIPPSSHHASAILCIGGEPVDMELLATLDGHLLKHEAKKHIKKLGAFLTLSESGADIVVFHNGSFALLENLAEMGKTVVTPQWLAECAKVNRRVDTAPYEVVLLQDSEVLNNMSAASRSVVATAAATSAGGVGVNGKRAEDVLSTAALEVVQQQQEERQQFELSQKMERNVRLSQDPSLRFSAVMETMRENAGNPGGSETTRTVTPRASKKLSDAEGKDATVSLTPPKSALTSKGKSSIAVSSKTATPAASASITQTTNLLAMPPRGGLIVHQVSSGVLQPMEEAAGGAAPPSPAAVDGEDDDDTTNDLLAPQTSSSLKRKESSKDDRQKQAEGAVSAAPTAIVEDNQENRLLEAPALETADVMAAPVAVDPFSNFKKRRRNTITLTNESDDSILAGYNNLMAGPPPRTSTRKVDSHNNNNNGHPQECGESSVLVQSSINVDGSDSNPRGGKGVLRGTFDSDVFSTMTATMNSKDDIIGVGNNADCSNGKSHQPRAQLSTANNTNATVTSSFCSSSSSNMFPPPLVGSTAAALAPPSAHSSSSYFSASHPHPPYATTSKPSPSPASRPFLGGHDDSQPEALDLPRPAHSSFSDSGSGRDANSYNSVDAVLRSLLNTQNRQNSSGVVGVRSGGSGSTILLGQHTATTTANDASSTLLAKSSGTAMTAASTNDHNDSSSIFAFGSSSTQGQQQGVRPFSSSQSLKQDMATVALSSSSTAAVITPTARLIHAINIASVALVEAKTIRSSRKKATNNAISSSAATTDAQSTAPQPPISPIFANLSALFSSSPSDAAESPSATQQQQQGHAKANGGKGSHRSIVVQPRAEHMANGGGISNAVTPPLTLEANGGFFATHGPSSSSASETGVNSDATSGENALSQQHNEDSESQLFAKFPSLSMLFSQQQQPSQHDEGNNSTAVAGNSSPSSIVVFDACHVAPIASLMAAASGLSAPSSSSANDAGTDILLATPLCSAQLISDPSAVSSSALMSCQQLATLAPTQQSRIPQSAAPTSTSNHKNSAVSLQQQQRLLAGASDDMLLTRQLMMTGAVTIADPSRAVNKASKRGRQQSVVYADENVDSMFQMTQKVTGGAKDSSASVFKAATASSNQSGLSPTEATPRRRVTISDEAPMLTVMPTQALRDDARRRAVGSAMQQPPSHLGVSNGDVALDEAVMPTQVVSTVPKNAAVNRKRAREENDPATTSSSSDSTSSDDELDELVALMSGSSSSLKSGGGGAEVLKKESPSSSSTKSKARNGKDSAPAAGDSTTAAASSPAPPTIPTVVRYADPQPSLVSLSGSGDSKDFLADIFTGKGAHVETKVFGRNNKPSHVVLLEDAVPSRTTSTSPRSSSPSSAASPSITHHRSSLALSPPSHSLSLYHHHTSLGAPGPFQPKVTPKVLYALASGTPLTTREWGFCGLEMKKYPSYIQCILTPSTVTHVGGLAKAGESSTGFFYLPPVAEVYPYIHALQQPLAALYSVFFHENFQLRHVLAASGVAIPLATEPVNDPKDFVKKIEQMALMIGHTSSSSTVAVSSSAAPAGDSSSSSAVVPSGHDLSASSAPPRRKLFDADADHDGIAVDAMPLEACLALIYSSALPTSPHGAATINRKEHELTSPIELVVKYLAMAHKHFYALSKKVRDALLQEEGLCSNNATNSSGGAGKASGASKSQPKKGGRRMTNTTSVVVSIPQFSPLECLARSPALTERLYNSLRRFYLSSVLDGMRFYLLGTANSPTNAQLGELINHLGGTVVRAMYSNPLTIVLEVDGGAELGEMTASAASSSSTSAVNNHGSVGASSQQTPMKAGQHNVTASSNSGSKKKGQNSRGSTTNVSDNASPSTNFATSPPQRGPNAASASSAAEVSTFLAAFPYCDYLISHRWLIDLIVEQRLLDFRLPKYLVASRHHQTTATTATAHPTPTATSLHDCDAPEAVPPSRNAPPSHSGTAMVSSFGDAIDNNSSSAGEERDNVSQYGDAAKGDDAIDNSSASSQSDDGNKLQAAERDDAMSSSDDSESFNGSSSSSDEDEDDNAKDATAPKTPQVVHSTATSTATPTLSACSPLLSTSMKTQQQREVLEDRSSATTADKQTPKVVNSSSPSSSSLKVDARAEVHSAKPTDADGGSNARQKQNQAASARQSSAPSLSSTSVGGGGGSGSGSRKPRRGSSSAIKQPRDQPNTQQLLCENSTLSTHNRLLGGTVSLSNYNFALATQHSESAHDGVNSDDDNASSSNDSEVLDDGLDNSSESEDDNAKGVSLMGAFASP